MEYCADWGKTKSRFEALWQGRLLTGAVQL